jgi:large-conductance mechanosensitive channel
MNAKRRREPIFVDGIYALIALGVIAWPLWILVKYLMDKLGWFSVHLFASQIIGFLILAWVVLVIIGAMIASIRKREEQMGMAD